jgi:hypothetical protein
MKMIVSYYIHVVCMSNKPAPRALESKMQMTKPDNEVVPGRSSLQAGNMMYRTTCIYANITVAASQLDILPQRRNSGYAEHLNHVLSFSTHSQAQA